MDTVRIAREDLEGLVISAYIANAIFAIDPDLFWVISGNIADEELEVSMSNFILEGS